MLGEIFLLGFIGFEIARRPALRKKAAQVAKKLPSLTMRIFEKGVEATSSYLINAWSDIKKLKEEKK